MQLSSPCQEAEAAIFPPSFGSFIVTDTWPFSHSCTVFTKYVCCLAGFGAYNLLIYVKLKEIHEADKVSHYVRKILRPIHK